MSKKLYVGNLSFSIKNDDLEREFKKFGTVTLAKVMVDRDTGRSKGFAFVEMNTDSEAKSAIEGLNGYELDGRALIVNEARPQEDRSRGKTPDRGRKNFW